KRTHLARLDGDAGGHGVATALGDEPGLDGRDDSGTEIDPGHGAAGACAGAIGGERDGEGGAVESLAQARGDETDNAGMPVGRSEDEDGRPLPAPDFGLSDACRLLDRGNLDALALVVEL